MEKSSEGFTIIELIIVIVIVGIVATYVIPKITLNVFKESADIDVFISNVRYAQHKSMVTGSRWRIKIDSLNSEYFLDNDSTSSNDLPQLPGEDNPVKLSSGISSNISVFFFDYLGRPTDNGNNLITTAINVIIGSKTIIIEPYSGGVYVQ